MTDVKKTEKADDKPVEKAPEAKEPEVVATHEVDGDTYYTGEDGSKWVVRGDDK
jgi:hypothetical protein